DRLSDLASLPSKRPPEREPVERRKQATNDHVGPRPSLGEGPCVHYRDHQQADRDCDLGHLQHSLSLHLSTSTGRHSHAAQAAPAGHAAMATPPAATPPAHAATAPTVVI